MSLQAFPSDNYATATALALFALLAGLARGFSGFGGALIFVPLASAVVGPLVAVPVLLLADLVSFVPRLKGNLGGCHWPQLGPVLAGALIGFPVGAQVLTSTDPTTIRWLASILILLSLCVLASGWRYHGAERSSVSVGVGLVSGAMSGLSQIGGPPVVVYWLGTDANVGRVRANLQIYFFVLMSLGLAIFLWKGLIGPQVLWLALIAAPAYALGTHAGTVLFPLASEQTFRRIAFALIAIAAFSGMPALDGVLRGR